MSSYGNNAAEEALARQFAGARDSLSGNAIASALRASAFEAFARAGLPTRRVEAWHYTDLRARMVDVLPLAPAPGADALTAAGRALEGLPEAACRIVLVDGVFCAPLSAMDKARGLRVTDLDEALAGADGDFARQIAPDGVGEGDAALALNAALMQGGVVVDIAPGARIEQPVEIVWVNSGVAATAVYSRALVRTGAGSSVAIVERHVHAGEASSQQNSALVIAVGDNGHATHVFLRHGGEARDVQVASLLASAGENARFESFALIDGGGLLRRQIFASFGGPQARMHLAGLALLRDRDHADTTLVVDHLHRDCESSEYFKHVIDGAGTGVFQGKIKVAAQAQKTDAAMKSQALLLSDDAAMYAKPELEIFADDVVCGHGATCGALDEDQLFYAMSRGLPRNDAEALLLEAFGADAISRVADEGMVEELTARLRRWLGARRS